MKAYVDGIVIVLDIGSSFLNDYDPFFEEVSETLSDMGFRLIEDAGPLVNGLITLTVQLQSIENFGVDEQSKLLESIVKNIYLNHLNRN